jgi:hypothetical protein
MAEWASGSIIRTRDPGLNFGVDKMCSYSVCVRIEFKSFEP